MYKNRAPDGRCNLCGQRVAQLRKAMGPDVSQRALADMLQLAGMDVDKNAIQRIESGKRNLSFEQCRQLAVALETSMDYLAGLADEPNPIPERVS